VQVQETPFLYRGPRESRKIVGFQKGLASDVMRLRLLFADALRVETAAEPSAMPSDEDAAALEHVWRQVLFISTGG